MSKTLIGEVEVEVTLHKETNLLNFEIPVDPKN